MYIHVVAARPNFIKVAPVVRAMNALEMTSKICHTGQHYNENMSDIFFEDLDIPKPDWNLGTGSGTHAQQTAQVMVACEELFHREKPKAVIVYGDVNSTLAAALAASKLHIPVIHIEAGSRSFDMKMPEEINRIVVDNISDLLFCIDVVAFQNLNGSHFFNIEKHLSGKPDIDSLRYALNKLSDVESPSKNEYALCTMHRPSNVDNLDKMKEFFEVLKDFKIDIIFPVHPRLRPSLSFIDIPSNVKIIEPLGYLNFINHMKHSKFIITDSGGVQCETSVLRKVCFLMRDTTEHELVKKFGTLIMCPTINELKKYTNVELPKTNGYDIPWIWDGCASSRIANKIKRKYE